ncbi:hypothetical protein M446_3039 [Methylobacterium sp. 4-46]|uniref:hypothetical protein n=1 Tax=unclassified Methylobacterium TaxID=2615210 RepID=UPI000152E544|nr:MULTISPECIES: hypothetical protein [Methylobacterium]ACA17450.1 hypothetical protein M446_3039 [Methylobacterium sp. 4-46]WFT83135.1 hypothetical protein QA634_15420 [Methylobacterium nodulans]
MRPPCAALLVLLGLVAAAGAARGGEARPRLCPQDAPPGVRLPDRPGCREAPRPEPLRAGPAPGFVDLGNGTQLRVGGRAVFEAGTRR